MKSMILAVGIVLLSATIPTLSNAAPNNVQNDLSEKCAMRAKEVFDKDFAHRGNFTYRNHYNNKLNKCFALITESTNEVIKIDLWDINELSIYGQIGYKKIGEILYCGVQVHYCKSKEQWDGLVKPFMEE